MVGELAVLGAPGVSRRRRPPGRWRCWWTEAEFRQLIAHDSDLSQRIFAVGPCVRAEQEALVASLAAVEESGPHVR
jgi:hypothetical protein